MQSQHLPIALILALFLHGVVFILIEKLGPKIPERTEKTVPTVHIAAERAAVSSQQKQANTRAVENRNKITTIANAAVKHQKALPLSKPSSRQQNNQVPKLPEINQPISKHLQRNSTANIGLQDLFGQNTQLDNNEINQIQEKDLLSLSDYELSLLKQLSRGELYKEYHRVLAQHQRDRIDFSIEIVLFPNGAIKRAKIYASSKIPEIDKLAIRTAYNASPFEKPPEDDIETGFRYVIPVSYRK